MIASIDSTGADFAGALTCGREVAAPKLRAMKEAFDTESLHAGARRADAWIDIEGALARC